MKLADTIATHPKILRAGALLGTKDGTAQALALYVAGLGYACHFLTNGFIPDSFVATSGINRSEFIAQTLAHRGVKLWHRVRGGYRIHDFFDWNDKASELKEKRAKTRARVAAFRARQRDIA